MNSKIKETIYFPCYVNSSNVTNKIFYKDKHIFDIIEVVSHSIYESRFEDFYNKYKIPVNLSKYYKYIMEHIYYINSLSHEDKRILSYKGTGWSKNNEKLEYYLNMSLIDYENRPTELIKNAPDFKYDYVFHGGYLNGRKRFLSTSLDPIISLYYTDYDEEENIDDVKEGSFHIIKKITGKCLFLSSIACGGRSEMELLFLIEDDTEIYELEIE